MCRALEFNTQVLRKPRKPALYGKRPQRRFLCLKDRGGCCELSLEGTSKKKTLTEAVVSQDYGACIRKTALSWAPVGCHTHCPLCKE